MNKDEPIMVDIINKLALEDWLKDKEALKLLAQANMALYAAFLEAGFNETQSLELVISLMKGAQQIKGS
jgi:hypothetical protein